MAKNIESGKRKHNIYSILGIIGDILFYPIIIMCLLCCFAIYADKQSGKVPSIFGVSMVSIKSGSMTNSGFKVKDIVFLGKTSAGELRAGDIIGFYYYYDSACDGAKSELQAELTLIQSYDRDTKEKTPFDSSTYKTLRAEERTGDRKTVDEINARADRLYFHRIVNVFIKSDGTLFYETQGDGTPGNPTNGGPETNYICEDYVVGKYIYTAPFIRGFFSFVATPTGMIALVVAPLAILTLCILFSIIEQISRILVEKRVLRRLIRFDSDESIKANIGLDMELADKVWFYATSEPADRREVREFLWGYLKNGKEKEVDRYQDIARVSQEFDDDPVAYWTYFIDSTKRKRIKKKINKAWQDWSIEQERQKMVVNPLKRKKKVDDKEASAESEVVETNPAEPESVQEEKPKEKKTKSKKSKGSSNSDTQDKK
ncbi:MAG: hypothetical protein IKT27_02110 [Clostridia bacterium]|nr:hypothetical protein [Clostridia bacterium]